MTAPSHALTPSEVAEQQHSILRAVAAYWSRRAALAKDLEEALRAALGRECEAELATIVNSHSELKARVQADYDTGTREIAEIRETATRCRTAGLDWEKRRLSDATAAHISVAAGRAPTERITNLEAARWLSERLDKDIADLNFGLRDVLQAVRQRKIKRYTEVKHYIAELLTWTDTELAGRAAQQDYRLSEIARSQAQAEASARARKETRTLDVLGSVRLAAGGIDRLPEEFGIKDDLLTTALGQVAGGREQSTRDLLDAVGASSVSQDDPERAASAGLSAAVTELRLRADASGPLVRERLLPTLDSESTADLLGPVRFGAIAHPDLASIPALFSVGSSRHLFVKGLSTERTASLLCSTLLRVVLGSLPGSVRLTLIDPVGAGAGLALFLALPVESRGEKAYVRPDEIEAQLRALNLVVESTLQTRLGTRFETLAAYNEANPAVALPYQLIAILGLPSGGWTERHAELLTALLRSGPQAGVHVLATIDTDAPAQRGVDLEAITRHGLRITVDAAGVGRMPLPELGGEYEFVADEPADARLAERSLKSWAQAVEGAKHSLGYEAIAVPIDWSGESSEGLEIPIGINADGRAHNFSLGTGTVHHALVGGMSGSGKTNLLRLLIAQLGSRFSPDDLGLYLLDFKEGVAFADYLELPHARAVSLETDREFALSMLRHLQGEIEARAKLFRSVGVGEFVPYRDAGRPLARLLLVMDEFQVLFGEDDQLAREAARILEDLVKRGRSFGIHVLLASQSPSLATLAGQRIYNQMGLRIAFRCLPQDALAILGEGNTGAAELDEPGEAIYNDELGAREHNRRTKVALLTDRDHKRRIHEIAALGAGRYPRPVTFEGGAMASIGRNPVLAGALKGETTQGSLESVEIWLGEPVEVKTATMAVLERYPRSNLLIAGPDEDAAYGLLAAALLSIGAEQPAARLHVLDFARPSASIAGVLGLAAAPFESQVELCGPREAPTLLGRLVALLDERLSSTDAGAPHYFLIAGLQRWRELRGLDSFQQTPEAKALLRLLDEGPDLRLHTIAWTDTVGALERVKSRGWGLFDLRVALHLSETDSTNLLGSAVASRLPDNRALFRHEDWPAGQLEKFKPYRLQEPPER